MSKHIPAVLLAVVIYAAFAFYLYQPYFGRFTGWDWLLPVNSVLAAGGCFLLSRRWVPAIVGSLVGGAVYGFGPYLLGLAKFHPSAGTLAAAVPWLFCPAAFVGDKKWRWLAMPLLALPFATICVFFLYTAKTRLFAIPLQTQLGSDGLVSLLAPLVAAKRGTMLLGFYHCPVAALVMGAAIFAVARRRVVFLVLIAGIVLACCDPLLAVSPFLWLSIPQTICCVLIAEGLQGLVGAGWGDRKWILLDVILVGAAAIVTLLLATQYFQVLLGLAFPYARLLTQAGKMYTAAAVALLVVFFMTRAKLRLHPARWVILLCVIGIDIFVSAQFIVDSIFSRGWFGW